MIAILTPIVVGLNTLANTAGRLLFAPIAWLPGWLSATIVAAVTGVLLLLIFKYTSNQAAIKRVRNDIDANVLALKLFKDATSVVLAAQAGMITGALRLFVLAIVPMLVMMVPVLLLLGQLSVWYQHRPLRVGDETVVAMKLGGNVGDPMPAVTMEETPAAEIMTGPVRVPSKREVVWLLRVREPGSHRLLFRAGEQAITKELAVGDGFMRVSPRRPDWEWSDALLNPAEPAFRPSSPVRWIEVAYPDRLSWTSGTDNWLVYWFAMSMVAAFCLKPALKVNI